MFATRVANGTTYTTSYTYDGNDNRKTITLPSTRILTYTYDYADRPASVVAGSTTYVSSASYEPFGPLDQLVFGNRTTQTRTFNQRYLLSEDKVTNSSATLADQTFTYNDAGFVTGITDNVTSGYNQSMTYGGRATNMLTGVQSGSSLWGLAQYADTYNQNLSTIAITGNSYGLQYNRAGQLTSIFNPSTNTSQSVTEDGAGNELTVGSSSYTYSSRNHLASGDGVSYVYDGLGRRVSATVSGTGTRVSLYDPNMHLQTESSLSSGSIAYDYIWFGGIPVAQEDIGGNTHWTVTDYRGAPYMQTDSSAAVYWQADYAPFGAVYALRTSDAHQPLRLPGQEAEEFTTGNANGYTGRFYNGYRWYRPLIGRYTQADPIDYAGGLMSLYTYAANNPVNYEDPNALNSVITKIWGSIMPYHIVEQIPSNAAQQDLSGVPIFDAPSDVSWAQVYQAGQSIQTADGQPPAGVPYGSGWANLSADLTIDDAIGLGGTYDFQRDGSDFIQDYTDASNFAVGVYLAGAGFCLNKTLGIGDDFAHASGSTGDLAAKEQWWAYGWTWATQNSVDLKSGVTPTGGGGW